jgi:ferredoxin
MGATLRDQQLIIGCAQAAASLPDNLRSKLFEVPCLATIGAELWFYALNETGISASSSISVFLPTTICAQCLVNRNANAENIYSDAISQAEVWSGRFVDILSKQEELAATDRKNLLDNLSNPEQGDRREVLESIMDNFKQSWNHAGEALEQSNQGNRDNPRLRQIIQQRQRNMNLSGIDLISGNFGGTVTDDTDINGGFAARLSANSNQTNCNSAKKLEPKRKALIAAMLDVPETAKQVSILLSTTDYSKCSGCKKCVDACPLDARRIVRGNSAILFSDLSPQTGPAATQVAFVDPLICTGCSACIQHCPEDACAYKTISGAELVKLCKPHA